MNELRLSVNLLANAYAGSNPALPTIFIFNDLGSLEAPFLLLEKIAAGHFRATFELPVSALIGRFYSLKLSFHGSANCGSSNQSETQFPPAP